MTDRAKIAEFVAFCIEAYAKDKSMSGLVHPIWQLSPAELCYMFLKESDNGKTI